MFWLLACTPESQRPHRPVPDPAPATDSVPTDSVPTVEVPTMAEAFEAEGFVVGEGRFVFSDMSRCCEPDAQCWGNNPSTPYGTPLLPPGFGQAAETAVDVVEWWGPAPVGYARTFRLREDEAFVTYGTMPPPGKYFSYRSYIGERPGLDHYIIGSLGPSLNHQVIRASMGREPWDQPVAIVTTFDRAIEDRVRAALEAAGWDPGAIVADRITGGVVHPGLGPDADSFFVALRVGVFDDPVAGEAYRNNPDLHVVRLTPETEEPLDSPWPWPDLPERGTGRTEDPALQDARNRLIDAVTARYADRAPLVGPALPYWLETLACVVDEVNCTGDIRDRFSAVTPGFTLGEDEAMVMVGANHERTGRASYHSASVQTIESQRGIRSFESPDMPGSAREFVPDEPLVDELYTWFVARDCSAWPAPCAEVPYVCPGVGLEEELKITVRAYLEPATGAAALPEEMVGDVAIKLFPPQPPPD